MSRKVPRIMSSLQQSILAWLTLLLVMLGASQTYAVEKWFQNGSGGGTGSQSDPYLVPLNDADAFDGILWGIFSTSDDVILHLHGQFTTWGNIPQWYRPNSYARLHISGNGMYTSSLKLADNAPGLSWGDGTTHKNVIRYTWDTPGLLNTYIFNFKVENITVDCNWQNNQSSETMVAGINEHCYVGLVSGVNVIHAGSNITTGGTVPEVFPIFLSCSDVPNTFSPNIDGRINPWIRVLNSYAANFYFQNSGYATSIMLVTGLNRTVETGLVQGCSIWGVPKGMALGCGNSDRIRFSGNYAWDCQSAFNSDAYGAKNLTIENNSFTCQLGINLGATWEGSYLWDTINIVNNTFNLGGPSSPYSYGFGVRVNGGCNNISISGATPSFTSSPSYQVAKVANQTPTTINTTWTVTLNVPEY